MYDIVLRIKHESVEQNLQWREKSRKEEEGPSALSCLQSPMLLALPSELVPFLIFIFQHHLKDRAEKRESQETQETLKTTL